MLCVGLRLHNPREPRRKPWRKPDGNRSEIGGDKADLILRPRFLRLSNGGGQRENPVSDGNTSLAHGVGASTLGFHALVRCAPNHPHPLSWKGTPPCTRRAPNSSPRNTPAGRLPAPGAGTPLGRINDDRNYRFSRHRLHERLHRRRSARCRPRPRTHPRHRA